MYSKGNFMQYRLFGNTGKKLSVLGLGTNRFLTNTEEELNQSVEIVLRALEKGINYIDTAYTYSSGKAFEILRKAFEINNHKFYISAKYMLSDGNSKDKVIDRINRTLEELGIEKATFGYAWSLKSFKDYLEIMKKDGVYEGLMLAKERGLIEHICFSSHASIKDTIKIIESGNFEGCIISYNILNYGIMHQVLETAERRGVGILTMNSLAGGLIPQYSNYFNSIKMSSNETVNQAALRFILAHKEITAALSSMQTNDELDENVSAYSKEDKFIEERVEATISKFTNIKGYCTGCNYCTGCPKQIPILEMMQQYNRIYFSNEIKVFNNRKLNLLECKALFAKSKFRNELEFNETANPCIKCGQCEVKCTQGLPIIKRVEELYHYAIEGSYTIPQRKERLHQLFFNQNYKKVAVFPAGQYTKALLTFIYRNFDMDDDLEIRVFDNNPNTWENYLVENIKINCPDTIEEFLPDCILVSNYNYANEIYNQLISTYEGKFNVVKLHNAEELPWF